jgi:hypothetical protein
MLVEEVLTSEIAAVEKARPVRTSGAEQSVTER